MDIGNQCLSVFKSFISDVCKVFPEYEIKLNDVYGEILKKDTCNLDSEELLTEFLDRVHKLNKKITNKDESMFEEDPLILTDISFKHMWTTNITYKTKETIWKYLQTFCLLALNHQSNKDLVNALNNLSDNKEADLTDKKVASDVKKIKKMTENIQEPIAEDISQPSEPEMINPFEQMMGGTDIGKIAQEVSQSLDFESLLGDVNSDNPMDILQNLMSGDAMGQIMGKIHSVVNEKVDSGELNREEMAQQAQGIYNSMGENPMLKAFGAMQQNMAQAQSAPTVTQAQSSNPHQSNKTRQRLQKKLKEKQKVQVNKLEE